MGKITTISESEFSRIKLDEGYSAHPYCKPGDVPTYGFGSTYKLDGSHVTMADGPISMPDAEQLLRVKVQGFEHQVAAMVTSDINQNQFDALVDFAYNEGHENLRSSTLLKKVNVDPSDASIHDEFMKWVYCDHKELPGLVSRRQQDSATYFA